jgi:hypothetical protein
MGNNFKNGDQKNRLWRLWVAFMPGSEKFRKIGPTYVYHNKEPDNEMSKERLINGCFTKFKDQIRVAILYDNQTGQEITRLK